VIVSARPREALDEAAADRVEHLHEHDRNRSGLLLERGDDLSGVRQDRVRRQGEEFRGISSRSPGVAFAETNVEPDVASFAPAEVLHSLAKCREASLSLRVVADANQHPNAPHPAGLLRSSRKRPCGCRAAEERDELAAVHSITSSARTKKVSAIARPSALAVLRLTISSNFVGCSIGRSAGLAPLRMRSTKYAARRYRPRMSAP
jgi:hypothetical protein